MKKAVVTGANGFLGRYLVRELENEGYLVWKIVHECIDKPSEYDELSYTIKCDIKDYILLCDILPHDDYDFIFHLAWAGSSGASREDYGLQLENAKGCADLASVAAILGCKRFVGAGSVTQLTHERYMQTDGSDPEMVACYAIGKIAAEYMSKCVCTKHGTEFVWGHIANFYGAGDHSENIINYLISEYRSGRTPYLTAGEQRADFMHVSDVARALIAAAERGRPSQSYYIGYGNPRPLKEFVLKTRDSINPNLESGLGLRSFHGKDIDFESMNIDRLHEDTGFTPEVSFGTGIRETVKCVIEASY